MRQQYAASVSLFLYCRLICTCSTAFPGAACSVPADNNGSNRDQQPLRRHERARHGERSEGLGEGMCVDCLTLPRLILTCPPRSSGARRELLLPVSSTPLGGVVLCTALAASTRKRKQASKHRARFRRAALDVRACDVRQLRSERKTGHGTHPPATSFKYSIPLLGYLLSLLCVWVMAHGYVSIVACLECIYPCALLPLRVGHRAVYRFSLGVFAGTFQDTLPSSKPCSVCAWQHLREQRPDALVVVMALFPRADPLYVESPYPWPLIDEVSASAEPSFGTAVSFVAAGAAAATAAEGWVNRCCCFCFVRWLETYLACAWKPRSTFAVPFLYRGKRYRRKRSQAMFPGNLFLYMKTSCSAVLGLCPTLRIDRFTRNTASRSGATPFLFLGKHNSYRHQRERERE